jgi:hypothetical protein
MNLWRLASGIGSWILLACLACGSTTSPSSTNLGRVTGTVGGASFVTTDAVSELIPGSSSAIGALVSVALTDFSGACADLGTGAPPASGAVIVLTVLQGASGQTYSIGGQVASVAYGAQYSSQCHTFTSGNSTTSSHFAVLQVAASGSVTLGTVDSTTVTGSFDATFPSGDHITGTFTAPNCPNVSQGSNGC